MLPWPIDGLHDSKKLSAKRREALAATVRVEAAAYGLGWVMPKELDEIGMSAAVKLAMQRAVSAVLAEQPQYDEIIIDGNINYLADMPRTRCEIKADGHIAEASAASIIAKVARDKYMYEMSTKYPKYGFDKHVGYGTAAHAAALAEHGVCPLHRRSFAPIRKYLES